MGTRRNSYTWVSGVGWVQKQSTEERNYDAFCTEEWAFLISFLRWYPDVACDIFRSDDAEYKNEELIQRMMMRAFARYQYVDITGCRSLTKTNTKFKQKMVYNLVWPNTRSSYYGPSYKQQAELAKTAFTDIRENYPVIAKHYQTDAQGKDTFGISTIFGSSLTINAIRGKNIHDVTAEEYAQEEMPAFDFDEYTTVVLYSVRLVHMVGGKKDPTYIPYQQHSITSAGRKQNHSFETRCKHLAMMKQGKSAFVMDVPWQVIVLSQMRPYEWAMQRKEESTADKWAREMESRYTGSDESPIVRDEVLTECRDLMIMEEHHCCKDRDNKLKPEDVIYVVGYDVSYEGSKDNAKCAAAVVKLTKQTDFYRRNKYKKDVVWVDDWSPLNMPSKGQAKKLKNLWYRFCFEGSQTYIAIDGWQYGKSVVEDLMADLGDGLAPLCVVDHAQYTELELEGAIPIIYPIKAGGAGVTDPDSEMIRYCEEQFEHRNVSLLTANRNFGVEAYKRYHRIKDSHLDVNIDKPYRKTAELVGQIQNLKSVPSGAGTKEQRISKHIQRDSWSALKYALRFAQKLEKANLQSVKKASDWDAELSKFSNDEGIYQSLPSTRGIGRRGGRMF